MPEHTGGNRGEEYGMGTENIRLRNGHRRTYPNPRSSYEHVHTTPRPFPVLRVGSDDNGFPPDFRPFPHLDRCIKAVHIEVEDDPQGGFIQAPDPDQ